MKIWQKYLTEQDHATLARGRFAQRMGYGERPAVVVIDAQNYMVGVRGGDSSNYPSSCGEKGWKAVDRIKELTHAARRHGVPVFYTQYLLAHDGRDMGVYRRKRALLDSEYWCLEGTIGGEIVAEVAPQPEDIVFVKKKPSGFFGTPLLGYLIDRRIDTVVVVGGATSNCVRATVFDAASNNFRVIVPYDAVFDRIEISHAISLFDMDRQFADVVDTDEVVQYFRQRARGAE